MEHRPWRARAVAGETLPPPDRARSFDVAVVGGGLVGLQAALRIVAEAPGTGVAVLERDVCGAGASGRNGGQLHSWWDRAGALEVACGEAEAVRLARATEAGIDELVELARRRPEVGLRQDGWVWTAASAAQVGSWDAVVARARELGGDPYREVPAPELERRSGSPLVRAAIEEPRGGSLFPPGLVAALREEALAAGVEIFERTPVRGLWAGSRSRLATAAGEITAGAVVLATNAWAARLPALRRRLFVVGSDMVLTAPVPDLLAARGWSGGEAVCDSQARVLYWTATPDGRVAFGRGGGRIAPFNRIATRFEGASRWSEDAAAAMRRTLPYMDGVEIEASWSGAVDRTVDGLPLLGRLEAGANVFYGVGWSGSGVVPSIVGGRVLAGLALGREDEWTRSPLVDRAAPAFPPEPLRTLGAGLVREGVRRVAAAEDEGREPSRPARALASLTPTAPARGAPPTPPASQASELCRHIWPKSSEAGGAAPEPFDAAAAAAYVAGHPLLAPRVGAVESVERPDEGNINEVYLVRGERGGVVLKQGLPWVRILRDWPLSAERTAREAHLMATWEPFGEGLVPELIDYDAERHVLTMELVEDHLIYREALAQGEVHADAAAALGALLARAAFHTSSFRLDPPQLAAAAAAAENPEMHQLMEQVVYEQPYAGDPRNTYDEEVAPTVAALARDRAYRRGIGALKIAHRTRGEALLHGDLHTGSVMVAPGSVRVIDAEFARYGPVAWDVGELWAHERIAAVCLAARGEPAAAAAATLVATTWEGFGAQLRELWPERRDRTFADDFVEDWLAEVRAPAVRFAGAEIARRVIGIGKADEVEELPRELRAAVAAQLLEEAHAAVCRGEGAAWPT
ncbi:MAG: FAD-dependent oxidoreductase [Actinobacteria bacterium]|nr:FAD-dependent oxidoreductase [Actinomycetota bacterium]